MKPEILLIHPKVGNLDKLGINLPINCLSIASILDGEGYKVKIIDQRIEKNWKGLILGALRGNPICAGITSMTGPQISHALEISKLIKKNSKIPVIWGGVHPTLLPNQTLKNENIDIVVKGEGEKTFYELVRKLERGKTLRDVKGICYKENGKIKKNPEREFIDLDELPDLPYHLVNLESYSAPNFSSNKEKSLSLETSRGCPFACGFCYNLPFNKCKWRGFSLNKVIERINILCEKGIKSLYFIDDNIAGNFKHFQKLIENLIKEKIDINWGAQGIRINSLIKMSESNNFLRKVEKSGCKELDIGIESNNPRILKLINKNQTIEDIDKISKKIKGSEIIFKYNFLVGLPTQTIKEIKQDVEFALEVSKKNKNIYVFLNIYTPLPKTPLFPLSVRYGFKPPKTLEGWSKLSLPNWILNFPSWLSKKEAKYLSNLSFLFAFSNKNVKTRIRNFWIEKLFNFYQPFANLRLKYNFNEFLVEKKIVEIFES